MLEDMVFAAVNEAIRLGREHANERVNTITGGMNLPGVF